MSENDSTGTEDISLQFNSIDLNDTDDSVEKWGCEVCSFRNRISDKACRSCNTSRPVKPFSVSMIPSEIKEKLLQEDSNNGTTQPSDWLITQCTILCNVAYDDDPIQSLRNPHSPHCFTAACVSDESAFDGRFLVAESEYEEEDYFFICFRGSSNFDDWLTNLNYSMSQKHTGNIHEGFLSRVEKFPLSAIMENLDVGKKVIITGHSLGGACASLLTVEFFSKYHLTSIGGNLSCVTFGSPLVGGQALQDYMIPYMKYFHNFVMPNDIVPLVLSLVNPVFLAACKFTATVVMAAIAPYNLNFSVGGTMDWAYSGIETLFSYKPFGNFYSIQQEYGKISVMSNAEIVQYFTPLGTPARVDLVKISHNVATYSQHLSNCMRPMSVYKGKSDLQSLSYAPTLVSAYLRTETETLNLRGKCLGFVKYCTIQDVEHHQLNLREDRVGLLQFQLDNKAFTRLISRKPPLKKVNLRVVTYFRRDGSVQAEVPFESPSDSTLVTPYILEKVCPIVTIMVNSYEGKAKHAATTIIQEMHQHCKDLADSIPLDFALRILQYSHTDVNLPLINALLNRIDQVKINYDHISTGITTKLLRAVLENLTRKRWDVDTVRKECGRYIFAFGKVILHRLSEHASEYTDHLLPNEIFVYENKTPVLTEFWSYICMRQISTILDFSSSRVTQTNKINVGNSWSIQDFRVTLSSRDELPVCGGRGMLELFSISRVVDNTQFSVAYISADWGAKELPPKSDFTTILQIYKDHKEKVKQKHVYIRDSNNGTFATFVLTRLLSKMTKSEILQLSDSGTRGSNASINRLLGGMDVSDRQINFAKEFATRDEYAFCSQSSMSATICILQSLLESIESKYANDPKFASNVPITVKYWDSTAVNGNKMPFLALVESAADAKDVTAIDGNNVNAVEELMAKAKKARFNSHLISMIIEDVMGYDEACLEIEREEGFFVKASRTLKAGLETLGFLPYAAYKKSIQAAKDRHLNVWRNVNYQRISFSSYADMVRLLYEKLGMEADHATTEVEMEAYIDSVIPQSVKTLNLHTIMQDKNSYFHDSKFEGLVNGMSSALVVFYLKMIHHCRCLRMLRSNLKLITIGGEANVGKSSLIEYFIGEDNMVDEPGVGLSNRTLLPIAYRDTDDASMIWCDLPGCTDKCRMDLSRLFTELGDVVIFLLNASTAEESADKSLEELLTYIVTQCTCPRLICINQADCYIKSTKKSILSTTEAESKLDKACEQWRQKELFKCIEKKASPILRIESSKKHTHILNSSDSSLSVWLTTFNTFDARKMTQLGEDYLQQLFFTADDVKEWVLANKS